MPEAVISINIQEDEKEYICNICNDNISENIIGLKCNPHKHIFCHDCILDWFKEIKNKKHTGNYPTNNMCPVCRKNGGFLPCLENAIPIKGIHAEYVDPLKKIQITQKPEIKICGASYTKLKETIICQCAGKPQYGGFCGRHKKFSTTIQDNVNSIVI